MTDYGTPEWFGYNPDRPYLDAMPTPDGPIGAEMPDGTIEMVDDWTINHTYIR